MSRVVPSVFVLIVVAAQHPSAFAAPVFGLDAGQRIRPGEQVTSPNGKCNLLLQNDGNLVWRFADKVLWHTNTCGNPDATCIIQEDGNLVVYSSTRTPLWSSGTNGKDGSVLRCQDDGNLVLYQYGMPVWSSTSGRTCLTVRFKREGAVYRAASQFHLYINGSEVASVHSGGSVEFRCDAITFGRNEVRIMDRSTGGDEQHPFYVDQEAKTGHTKYFYVVHPGQEIEITAGFNTFQKMNRFDLSHEVPPDAAEVLAVSFEPEYTTRDGRVGPWQPVPVPGAKHTHNETVTLREAFTVCDHWKIEAEVRGKVVSLLGPATAGSVEGRLRGEYERTSTSTVEFNKTTTKGVEYQTPPDSKAKRCRYVRVDHYKVGKMTMLLNGLVVYDVPIETLDGFHVDVRTE